MTLLLEARGVTKQYDSRTVLSALSFSLSSNEIVLLLGQNGAGKSTLLRVLTGLVRPDSGSLSLQNSSSSPGYYSHYAMVYRKLSVAENCQLFLKLESRSDLRRILDTWQLTQFENTVFSNLSKGNQSKVALARTLGLPRAAYLLDEPTSNLDDQGVERLKIVIKMKVESNQCGLLIASHDIHRLRDIATRVIVMHEGALIHDSKQPSDEKAAGTSLDRAIQIYQGVNR